MVRLHRTIEAKMRGIRNGTKLMQRGEGPGGRQLEYGPGAAHPALGRRTVKIVIVAKDERRGGVVAVGEATAAKAVNRNQGIIRKAIQRHTEYGPAPVRSALPCRAVQIAPDLDQRSQWLVSIGALPDPVSAKIVDCSEGALRR